MASTLTRRPVPALVALLALLLLTGLVWWRVLNRDSSGSTTKACSTPSSSTPSTLQTLPAPSTITAQVLNSTDRSGIAAQARTTLVGLGFQVPAVATNDAPQFHNKIPGVGQIRFGPGADKAARTLSFYLPGATLVPTASKTSTVVVSLGTKYHAIATAAQAAAAMAKAHVQVGSGTPTPSGASPSC